MLFKGAKQNIEFGTIFNKLTYLLAFVIPLGNSPLNSVLLGLLAVTYALGKGWKGNRLNTRRKLFFSHILFYFVLVLGLLYTSNINDGLFQLQVKLPMVILPVLFLTSSFVKKEDIRKIALAFSAGVFVYTLFLGIYKFFSLDILQFDDFTHANIAIYHPSYLSIYVAFAIAVMIDTLLGKPFNRLILLFAISYLTVFCFLLASKVAILGLFLSLLYYLFLGLKRKGAKYVSVFVITLFSGFLILLVYSPNLKNRLITSPMSALANYKKVDSKDQASWPISFRIQILDCTKTLLENGNILYGYGTGDSNDELKKCYREKEYGWLMVRDLNSHNEYLNILLKVGLVGLCLLLICLFYPFFTGKGFTENKMYFVFLVLTILVFLGENFLDRHKGVIFYSFFNSLFMLGITPKRL